MLKVLIGMSVAGLVAVAAPSQSGQLACLPLSEPIHSRFATREGVASWYGDQFQGQQTTSGEAYNMNAFTAAHPNLPLGSKILVTNLNNHHALVLRVNDRGPSVPGRILDVSRAAARRLGFKGAGLAKVKIQVLSVPTHSPYRADCPGAHLYAAR
jgi:rare lipoprotein A (peptidoglycan hydrolase)